MRKNKNIKIVLYFVFVFLSVDVVSQNLRFNDFSRNYNVQKAEFEAYLDSLHPFLPDSIFFHEGSEYSQFKQWESYWSQRLPDGDFDSYFDRLKQGFDDVGSRSSSYDAMWHEVGPIDEPSGVMPANVGQSAGIGPIEFVRFYKNNLSKMICGSTKGGLFYSDNGGDNWANAGSDHWNGISAVTWAEFKSDDPEVIYASSCMPGDNEPGEIQTLGGIYRAQKNGTINPNTQWDKIADYATLGVTIHCKVKKILTDPTDPNILYIITSEGLLKSTNINSPTPTWLPPLLTDNVFDLEMKPDNHLILYATFNSPSSNSNIVKYSVDGGINWNPLPNLPSYASVDIKHVVAEVSESFPDNIYLYYYGNITANKNLFRYNYVSQTFSQINTVSPIDNYTSYDLANCCFGNGSAFGVAQSGVNEVIFVAFGDRYVKYLNGVQTLFGYLNPNHTEYHVDMEGFTFNPSNANEVWMACHGGTYKSINQGDNWNPKMSGVGVAMVFYMAASYENPEDILIGTYHDGCILSEGSYFDGWEPPWKFAYGGDGQSVVIDKNNPNNMYASGVQSPWAATSNGDTPFTPMAFYTPPTWGAYGVLNKVDSKIMYGTRTSEVNRSLDVMTSSSAGTIISNFAAITGTSSDVYAIYNFESNKDLVIVGLYKPVAGDNYDLYYTLKGTDPSIDPIADWHKININNMGRGVSDVEIDPLNPNNIYIAMAADFSGGSTKMINKVENFALPTPTIIDMTHNFPVTTLTHDCLVVEKGSDGGMYVATDLGAVFYTNNKLLSSDPSNAWVQFGDNYPHLITNGLEINYKINKIRAVPYGRGIWEADLYCPQDLSFIETGSYATDKFLEAQNTINSDAQVNSGLNINYRAGDEIKLTPGFVASSGSNFRAFIHPCNQPGNSFKSSTHGIYSTEENEEEEKKEAQSNFSVSNPVSDKFFLFFDDSYQNKQIVINIVDVVGQNIFRYKTIAQKRIEIPCEGLKPGVYIVRIESKMGYESKKVLVIH